MPHNDFEEFDPNVEVCTVCGEEIRDSLEPHYCGEEGEDMDYGDEEEQEDNYGDESYQDHLDDDELPF